MFSARVRPRAPRRTRRRSGGWRSATASRRAPSRTKRTGRAWSADGSRQSSPMALLNIAQVGAAIEQIEHEQLPIATGAGPDLLTLICGGNDVIRRFACERTDLAADLDRIYGRFAAALSDTEVLTATYPPICSPCPQASRPVAESRTGCAPQRDHPRSEPPPIGFALRRTCRPSRASRRFQLRSGSESTHRVHGHGSPPTCSGLRSRNC